MNRFHLVCVALAAALSSSISAQCTNLLLTSQGQVNAFTCSVVTGDLVIRAGPATPIVDLHGLFPLTAVGGDLIIENNGALIDISGMSHLVAVGGALRIRNNGALTNLAGLGALRSVGGELELSQNGSLADASGLSALANVGQLSVANNPALLDLGMTSLTNVVGDVHIGSNAVLPGLDALAELTVVGGNLVLVANGLQQLDGLRGLSSVDGLLDVRGNLALMSFCGLFELLSAGHVGAVQFSNNGAATSAAEIVGGSPCGSSEITAPIGFEEANPEPNSAYLWPYGYDFHTQSLYDESHFLEQGVDHPIAISRLRLRASSIQVDPGGQVYSNVVIEMSTSPSDYLTMSNTFAANTGGDVVQVFSGNVVVLPSLGGKPNNHNIDIVLQTPFLYDPTLGQDLCIDVLCTGHPSSFVPPFATAYDHTVDKVRALHASSGMASGSLNDGAGVFLIDFTIPAGAAYAAPFGQGCPDGFATFYEEAEPGRFSLGAVVPGAVNSIRMVPDPAGGYTVTAGSNQWHTASSPDLGLDDDAISAPQMLPFSFPYDGGTTSQVVVESNGNVWLESPMHTSFLVRMGGANLVSRGAVICAAYRDLDPSAATGAGSIHFDVDPAAGAAYVTWDGVPDWIVNWAIIRPTNTFQVALFSTGEIELRYQQMDTSMGWARTLTGFSPGANNRDPGSTAIMAALPFSTEADATPLSLSTNDRPLLGTTVMLNTSDIPAGALLSTTYVSLARRVPALPLDLIGMPGCFQHVGLDVGLGLAFGTPNASWPFGVTSNTVFAGVALRAQSLSLVPGVNALGVLSSNGLELRLGSL